MNKIFNKPSQKEKRRILRSKSTSAEQLIWTQLRGRRFHKTKFRRQFSVGFFVLDFYCPELKLAIEVDGYTHDSQEAQKYDKERQLIVEEYGIKFLRFHDAEVHGNVEKVLVRINDEIAKLKGHTSPQPSPRRGEGE